MELTDLNDDAIAHICAHLDLRSDMMLTSTCRRLSATGRRPKFSRDRLMHEIKHAHAMRLIRGLQYTLQDEHNSSRLSHGKLVQYMYYQRPSMNNLDIGYPGTAGPTTNGYLPDVKSSREIEAWSIDHSGMYAYYARRRLAGAVAVSIYQDRNSDKTWSLTEGVPIAYHSDRWMLPLWVKEDGEYNTTWAELRKNCKKITGRM